MKYLNFYLFSISNLNNILIHLITTARRLFYIMFSSWMLTASSLKKLFLYLKKTVILKLNIHEKRMRDHPTEI